MLQHKDDDFTEVQEYMKGKSIENCRMSFKIRCEMVQDIKGNFKDKFRRKGGEEALSCKVCGDIESQSHCVVCPQWQDIRSGLDVDKLSDLVIFFQKLLMERNKAGDQARKELHTKPPAQDS